jgi:proliferating cell nuclear antigen PCNA
MSVFEACTAQATAFKGTIDALVHAHICETTLVVDKKGLSVRQIDPGQCLVVDLLIESPSFQTFVLAEDETHVGINVHAFQRVLRSLTNKDTVTLSILYEEPIFLRVAVFNEFTKSEIVHKLRVLALDYEKVEIPQRECDRIVSMPSADFARHVKDFGPLSKALEFEADNSTFYVRAKSDLCISEAAIHPKNNVRGEQFGNGSTHIGLGRNGNATVRQSFNTKYLQSITKASSLDSQITLYLTRGHPLIARYNVSIIGSLRYILAEHHE